MRGIALMTVLGAVLLLIYNARSYLSLKSAAQGQRNRVITRPGRRAGAALHAEALAEPATQAGPIARARSTADGQDELSMSWQYAKRSPH